jgi:anhydro-N-acetylmuramic acid kinase
MKLNDLGFYTKPYPKSLGFEYVKTTVIPLIEKYAIPATDKLATYTEHIAVQLAAAVKKEAGKKTLLITGGGAYNDHLIMRLKDLLPDFNVTVPDDKTIQYKEALIFGLLGVLRLREEINVLSSVTGAPADHCAGFIYEPI